MQKHTPLPLLPKTTVSGNGMFRCKRVFPLKTSKQQTALLIFGLLWSAWFLGLVPSLQAQAGQAEEWTFSTFAGPPEDPGASDGTGSAARFGYPQGVAVDSVGNVYVADANAIRKVTPDGVVTTLAGLAGQCGSADGTGSAARFHDPNGVAVDSAGNVYVADNGNNIVRFGTPACPDRPTVDIPVAPAGLTRQLDTSPQTAVAWQWSMIRRPAASKASLSDPNVRNPTFTPDVADLYIFRLEATNSAGDICIRTVDLRALPADESVLVSPRQAGDGFHLSLVGQTNQNYTVQVSTNLSTWTDWTNVTSPTSITPVHDPDAHDRQRFYRISTR